jgi:hypothetical protein
MGFSCAYLTASSGGYCLGIVGENDVGTKIAWHFIDHHSLIDLLRMPLVEYIACQFSHYG